MWLKSQSKVSTLLEVLIILEIHLTFARAAFWVSPLSGDCCWTPELAVKSREMSSNWMCAMYCAQNNCDSFYFNNGLCELSHTSMCGMKAAVFKRREKNGETREVARNKPIQGTPIYTNNELKRAVDGNTLKMYHSADETPQPWILVDLENNFWVSKVKILLRTDVGHSHRTLDIKTLLGTAPPPTELDFSQYTEVGYIEEPLAVGASWQEYEVSPPLCSRYVAVMKAIIHEYDENILQVYEVEVLAAF